MESFEKLYPAERIVTLLGRLDIEGERDEATLVLVDDGGKKYALESPTPAGRQREYRGKWAVVERRTTDRTSRDGHPVLELVGIRMGTDVDRMADLSGHRSQRPQVVPEREPLITGEVQVNGAALECCTTTAAAGLPPIRPARSGALPAGPARVLLLRQLRGGPWQLRGACAGGASGVRCGDALRNRPGDEHPG